MKPLFTIAIPCYKAAFLEQAVRSCLSQTYREFEVVIVNDASPEDIDSIINQFDDHRIRYYKNTINNGAENVVDTWNQCLEYAQGEYMICMGDDDKLLSDCLLDYHQLISQYPMVDVLHTRTQIIDEDNNIIAIQEERPIWESALTMLQERWDRRWRQFIGDFCFKTSSLRNDGGFYKLPLAWSSDDISAFRAALTSGIANVQTFGFQYRDNSQTISNSSSFRLKAIANIAAINWYQQSFVNLRNCETIDSNALCTLETNVVPFHLARVRKMMEYDIEKSIINIGWWVVHKKQVMLNNNEILAYGLSCAKKQIKGMARSITF